MIHTEAWVLHEGPQDEAKPVGRKGERPPSRPAGELILEKFAFEDLKENEVLVEPIYGCWEGNMSHAVDRSPIDICRARGEPRVVLGNSGVVRVLRTGSAVRDMREGDVRLFVGTFDADEFGYMTGAHGYDSPNTVGFLAKATKFHASTLHKLPEGSRFSLRQWAAFSLRYLTAWSNWNVALGALRLQLSEQDLPVPHVWGWGGGTTLAELSLARIQGCAATMISGSHVEEIQSKGITALDRHKLGIIDFDERRFGTEDEYRQQYLAGEKQFLREVKSITGRGVSIFVDLIGSPVHRMTLKSLARQAVITTAGWKLGMLMPVNRAVECISRHVHVFTHYVRAAEAAPAIAFAEQHGWMPDDRSPVYQWEDIPRLVSNYRDNKIASYYPLFEVTAP